MKAIALSVILVPSCGMKKMATNTIGKIAMDGMVAIESEEDISFARETALSLIKTLEVLRYGNPQDARSLTLLSMSYGQYAFGFLESDMISAPTGSTEYNVAKARADLFYRRGKEFGIAALSSLDVAKILNTPMSGLKKSLQRLSKKNVPTLFWTAFNWANYLNLHLDDPEAIADLPKIEAFLDRVLELDPDFYYGSAHAFKGTIASMRPKMLGGNPVLADKEFKLAMETWPNYLMTKILYAQYYARQIQDVSLFRNTLSSVISADPSALPQGRLANELAKQRARLLLNLEKKLF